MQFSKNLINKIKNIKYKQYVKTNVLFIVTVLTLTINGLLLRAFTVKNYFAIKPFVADLAVALILSSFGYLFKPKKQIVYFMVLSILLTTVCVVNSMYFTFYQSFASVSLIATSFQIVDVGDALVQNVIQLKDFTYIWQPITILVVHFMLRRKDYYNLIANIEKGKQRFIGTMIASGIIVALLCATLTGVEVGRLIKQWNREYLVTEFGIYVYQVNDIVRSIEPKFSSIFGYDNAIKTVKTYYENRDNTHVDNKYTNIFKGKNLLLIHDESMQEFTMNTKFNGEEVTPNMNKLAKEGMFFSNFYSQVSVGTSSDTEFTLATSLLPVSNGTVFISYWDRQYVAIPQLLKQQGYYTFSMHGNNGTFWNRLTMYKHLGYDMFYHQAYYKMDDIIGLGLSDKSFFRQSVDKLKTISQQHSNYYGTLIMLTNHTPFDEVDKYGDFPVTMKTTVTNPDGTTQEVDAPYMEGTTLGNYFKSVHYADSAIGEFIDEMDKAGLLDNTVIVIYGDHDARLAKKDYVRFYNYDPATNTVLDPSNPNYKPVDYYSYELNRKVPLIIWTKDKELQGQITEAMGMYDVLPTLGNMFGFSSPYALGHDIFSTQDNVVVFPNGNWLTDKIYYNSQKDEYKPLTNEAISQSYIDKYTNIAENEVEVSNDFIVYDYLKHEQESNQVNEGATK